MEFESEDLSKRRQEAILRQDSDMDTVSTFDGSGNGIHLAVV